MNYKKHRERKFDANYTDFRTVKWNLLESNVRVYTNKKNKLTVHFNFGPYNYDY